MKFSIAILATVLGAAIAAPVTGSLPEAFTLVADGGLTVLTDGQYLYFGGDQGDKEIAVLRSGPSGHVTFTSKDGVPTAFQNLYVVEDTVLPVSMTIPHSAAVPEDGSITDFGMNEQGYFTHAGKDYFAVDGYGDNPQKQVYWYGAHNSVYRAANLWVKECKGC